MSTKAFSICRLLDHAVSPHDPRKEKAAEREIEMCQEAKSSAGIEMDTRGFRIPVEAVVTSPQRRDLTAGTATAGAEMVGTDHLASNFIDILRNKVVTALMGASVLPDLVGNVAIPRITSGSSVSWVGEGVAVSESQPAFDQVELSPKTVGAYTDISRKLIKQATPAADAIVINDIARAIAVEIDKKALYGDGTGNAPTGIVSTTGINTPTHFAGAVPTWPEVLAMMGAVDSDNALMGFLGFVTDPGTRAALMAQSKDSGSGQFVWSESNTMAGYRALASNQITSGDVFFANWEDLIIGLWGSLDIVIDKYTHSSSGGVRIVAFQDVDIAVRHPSSFAFNNDGV